MLVTSLPPIAQLEVIEQLAAALADEEGGLVVLHLPADWSKRFLIHGWSMEPDVNIADLDPAPCWRLIDHRVVLSDA